jgi:hypothetical protein
MRHPKGVVCSAAAGVNFSKRLRLRNPHKSNQQEAPAVSGPKRLSIRADMTLARPTCITFGIVPVASSLGGPARVHTPHRKGGFSVD